VTDERVNEWRRSAAEHFADALSDEFGFVVLIGFEVEPPGLHREIERLGGEELLSMQQGLQAKPAEGPEAA
jgi:hypothetical protein